MNLRGVVGVGVAILVVASDRWAFVWLDHEIVEEYKYEVFLHTYGCL
jgi:hypothetical protein